MRAYRERLHRSLALTLGLLGALGVALPGTPHADNNHDAPWIVIVKVRSRDPGPITGGLVRLRGFFEPLYPPLEMRLGPGVDTARFVVPVESGDRGGLADQRVVIAYIPDLAPPDATPLHSGFLQTFDIPCRWEVQPPPPLTHHHVVCDPLDLGDQVTVSSLFGNIAGTVRDTTGRPIAGAVVTAAARLGPGGEGPARTTTDGTGFYRFRPFLDPFPMFGIGIPVPCRGFNCMEQGTQDYDVHVAPPGGGPPASSQRVTVRGGEIATADFALAVTGEDRPKETAQGPPTTRDGCLGYVGGPINVTTGYWAGRIPLTMSYRNSSRA